MYIYIYIYMHTHTHTYIHKKKAPGLHFLRTSDLGSCLGSKKNPNCCIARSTLGFRVLGVLGFRVFLDLGFRILGF